MSLLKTSPWMSYGVLSKQFSFSTLDRAIWKVCRNRLRDFFELPDLPRDWERKKSLQIQLVAHTEPGPNRIKVENCREHGRENGKSKWIAYSAVIDGKLRFLHIYVWVVAHSLLKKRKALYVECFHQEGM